MPVGADGDLPRAGTIPRWVLAPPAGHRSAVGIPVMSGLSAAELDALIAEATVDCYDEDEQDRGSPRVEGEEDSYAAGPEFLEIGYGGSVDGVDQGTAPGYMRSVPTKRSAPRPQ